jgi:dTDP-4-dehydrorhamnose reductase
MRWVIVGAGGMLGRDLVSQLVGEQFIALGKEDCDITDLNSAKRAIGQCDVLINCAAYTAVDNAEKDKTLAFQINAEGPKNLAKICKEIDSKLVQISTDYVFSGKSKIPYCEDDSTNPQTVYGESKLTGEEAVKQILPDSHYIVRTAWLYGKHGNNFPKTILKLAESNTELQVVNDQFGQPTWTRDLASKVVEIVKMNIKSGTYHGTSEGITSWYEFAQKIFLNSGLDPLRIKPVDSKKFTRAAARPGYSVLGHDSLIKAGIEPIQNWESALEQAFSSKVFSD